MYAIIPNPSSFKLGWTLVRERENGDKIDWLTHEEAIFALRALEKRAWDMNTKTSLASAPSVVADVSGSADNKPCLDCNKNKWHEKWCPHYEI